MAQKKNYYKLEDGDKKAVISRINALNMLQVQMNDMNLVFNSLVRDIKAKAKVDDATQIIQFDESFSGFYINPKPKEPVKK